MMANKISQAGLRYVAQWVKHQRRLKQQNPGHRTAVDVCMEVLHSPTTTQLVRQIYKDRAMTLLNSSNGMRSIELGRIWQQMQSSQSEPPGGAGGLGIIGETIASTAATYGAQDNYGLLHISLLHTQKRSQTFEGNRQRIKFISTRPEQSANYEFLGNPVSINFNGKQRPVEVWLFKGFESEKDSLLSLRLRMPEVTGKMYPKHDSSENFDQMHVLGAGGFKVAQHFGIIGVEDHITDLVIGHDGHTALFKLNLYLHLLKIHNDPEVALQLTRKLCVATIHAPQVGTVPRTHGDMVRRHYSEEAEKIWGFFGAEDGKMTNAMFAEISLSHSAGGVSPLHLMVTGAEEKARRRGFSSDAPQLLPGNVDAGSLKLFPDTIAMDRWLGIGTLGALDKHFPEWRENPSILGKRTVIDRLRLNPGFREDLAQAFDIQHTHLLKMLNENFPTKFGENIPKEAIIIASLRRATKYKIGLLTDILRQHEIFEEIAADLKRPIFYLLGGLAHQADHPSIDSLQNLLGLIQNINNRGGKFKADFLIGYDIDKAPWIFPGLAMSGCWVGATNPISHKRSQGTEAFGPSYMKAAANGAYIIGPDDGGAGSLASLPTVHIYGPTTFVGNHSLHDDLWANRSLVGLSPFLLANGFIGNFRKVAGRITENLHRFERGRGENAPGLGDKVEAMCRTIAKYNGRALMGSYLSEV
ncbi:MAG: hypothetical protein U9R38_02715 [Candidatus Margulisiibacteriota bacterium]|nr:hypothetical protein [Candidatus Margulisiibacteriota bacterium]